MQKSDGKDPSEKHTFRIDMWAAFFFTVSCLSLGIQTHKMFI